MTDPQTAPQTSSQAPPQPDPLDEAVRSYLSRPRVDPARASLVGAAPLNPDQQAKMQRSAQVLGIPPAAAQGAPEDAALQARMKQMGLDRLSLDSPRTAAFLSNPQNAAVAHDDLPALRAMEFTLSNGQKQTFDVGSVSADPRSAFTRFLENKVVPTLQGFPVTRAAIGTLGGSVGMAGDIASFAGLHGDNNGPNALQRFQRSLDPSVTGADTITGSQHLPFDTIAQNLGPLLPTLGLGAGTGLATRGLGLGETGAALVAGGTVGTAFTAQQGGQAYSGAIAMGKTPDEARAIADRVALINAPANIGLGMLAPKLRGAAPLALGAAQGASGQVSQNYIEGKPLDTDLLGGTVKGAAFMMGLHGAMETLGSGQQLRDLQAIADQSKLRGRMPERFADAVNAQAEGTGAETVRVPAAEFDRVMAQQGLDPEQEAAALNAKNYAEAKLAGSDLLIPTGDYLAHLAPTEAGKELAQHARLTPDALSEAEMRTLLQSSTPEGELEAQGRALAPPEERASKVQAIAEDTQRQLEGAGFTPSVASAYAQLHANALSNLAERGGFDPLDLQRRFPLSVTREGLPEVAVPHGTQDGQPVVKEDSPGRFSIVDEGGKHIGSGLVKETASHIQLSNIGIDDPTYLKKGYGVKAYEYWINKALSAGKEFRSDQEVSTDAQNIYKALEKRGYKVEKNESAKVEVGGKLSTRGWGIFRIRPPQEEVQVQPVERRTSGDRAGQIRELIGKRKAGTLTPEEGERLHDLNEQERVQAKVGGKDIPGALNTNAYADEYAAGRLKSNQVFTDLDDFKRVNDTFGHAAGDQAIRAFGSSLVKHFGEGDVFHRGGDEFVVQHDDAAQAHALMEQVRQDMAAFKVKGGVREGEQRQQTGIGLSYGVGPVSDHVNEITGAQDPSYEAEQGLYADKAARKAAGLRVGVREDVPKGTEPTELAQGPDRGTIRFGNGKGFKITLLDGADLSTFLHETGHLYTELLHGLAQEPGASEQLKADYQTLRVHAGADSGFGELTTEQHETLARSLEAYLREGKAPSEALRTTFERVKNWLKLIYRSALDLKVNISDDVRQVFNRIYASDAEIEAAKPRTGDAQILFRSAAEMGVSQGEFEDYIGRTEMRDRTAKDALRRVLMGDYQRELEKGAQVEREHIRAQVQEEFGQDPRYKAWDALKEGQTEDGQPVKLSREALVERYGEEAVKALPTRLKRLLSASGGLDADGAADLLGFRSGDALLANLRDLPPQKEAVAAETDRRYKLQNPDALTDGTLPARASEALHNRSREEVLATELRALRRLQGARASDLEGRRGSNRAMAAGAKANLEVKATPPAKAFRTAAKAIISDTQVRDLDPRGYLAAGRRASAEANKAFAKHDFAAAADAKQRELLSHHLYLEAVKARDEVGKVVKRANGLQKPEAQARLAKAGGTYREQVNALLGRYEMTRVPLETLAKREALAEWAQRQREEGFEPDLSSEVLDETRRINYRQATVGELSAVGDALKSISHVAKQQLEMVVNGRKLAFEAVKGELRAAAKASGSGHGEPLSGTDKTIFQRIGSGLVGADAMIAKMERVFRMLDGDKIGPWTKQFFRPIAEAQGKFYDLNRKVTAPLREAMQALPKAVKHGLTDTFEVDGFDQPINRRQLLTMALNQGNEGNQRVLREGYGLTQEQVDAAMKNLSGDEAHFVAKAWQILELLREPAGDLQKRMSGVAPEWVESKPYTFQTKDGEVHTDGGYFPLVRDPDRTTVGPKTSADALMGKDYVRATTGKGYLEERTGATYPVLLDFQKILSSHIVGVTKDIAFREPAVAINKLMSDQSVRLAVDDALGRSYRKQIEPWLRNILNDSNDTAAKGIKDLSTWVNTARRNASAATIGFKITSMLSIPTDLFRAWEPFRGGDSTTTRVATTHLAAAYRDFMASPLETMRLVRELSPEMRDRPHGIDRDIRSAFQHEMAAPAFTGKPLDAMAAFKNHLALHAYEGFAVVDAMVSVPTWLGAYRQAMAQGLPEADARFQADATVRLSLEAGQPKDLVALQRNNDFARLITMFNGWGFSAYDLMRSLGRDAKTPAGAARLAFHGLLGISVSNMMASLLTGHGPQKDESWGAWAARVGLLSPFEVIPLVRDMADYTVGRLAGTGGDMRISPVLTMFEKLGKAAVAQGEFVKGDMELPDYLTVTGEALGLLTGTPGTAQVVATTKYLRRVANGEEVPDNGADLAYHAAVGKPKGK